MSQILNPSSGGGGGGTVTSVLGKSGAFIETSGTIVTVSSPLYADASAPALLVKNTGSFCVTDGTYTLPASAGMNDGDLIEIIVISPTPGGGVILQASGVQVIHIASESSTPGGTASNANPGDSLSLRFRVTDGSWWAMSSINGTWVLA